MFVLLTVVGVVCGVAAVATWAWDKMWEAIDRG